jgi:chromosome segregation ATPase
LPNSARNRRDQRLKIELGEKNAAIFALEAREKALKDQLRTTEEEFTTKTQSLRTAEQQLADKQADLGKLTSELSERAMTADSRQVELVAVRSQIEMLQSRVNDAEKEVASSQQRLTDHRNEADIATRELSDARGKVESLSGKVGDLDRQLVVQTKETELLSTRVTDLETASRSRARSWPSANTRTTSCASRSRLRSKPNKAARRCDVRTGNSAAMDKLRSEKTALEEQLTLARDERAKLQRDINRFSSRRKAHGPPSAWKMRLRERINDIAAEVAKLAVPSKARIADRSDPCVRRPQTGHQQHRQGDHDEWRNAERAAANGTATEARGTLAERIRALQTHASRACQPG